MPLVEFHNVSKNFKAGRKLLHAVQSIDLTVEHGETLGIVGESGCGKSTLGRLAIQLEEATEGAVFYRGLQLGTLSSQDLKALRRKMQMIFQDPYSSLNPRMAVHEIIEEPLIIHNLFEKKDRKLRAEQLLTSVGLGLELLKRYPHALSGGQRQRVSIARALAAEPEFLVCDEPLSALDALTQYQVMELLLHLKKELSLTILFISHDMHAVKKISDRIAVMYLGNIVEMGSVKQIFNSPSHPYTAALLSAIPIPDPRLERKRTRIILNGDPPSPFNLPQGCIFQNRCPLVKEICKQQRPILHTLEESHVAACHFAR